MNILVGGMQIKLENMVKFRPTKWYNTETKLPVWGIQAKLDKWTNVATNNKPLFFNSEDECKSHIKQLMTHYDELSYEQT